MDKIKAMPIKPICTDCKHCEVIYCVDDKTFHCACKKFGIIYARTDLPMACNKKKIIK